MTVPSKVAASSEQPCPRSAKMSARACPSSPRACALARSGAWDFDFPSILSGKACTRLITNPAPGVAQAVIIINDPLLLCWEGKRPLIGVISSSRYRSRPQKFIGQIILWSQPANLCTLRINKFCDISEFGGATRKIHCISAYWSSFICK
jgi:hypothetical protein